MAVGVISGASADDRGSVYNVDSQRLVIDMRNEIAQLEPDATPLTTLSMHPSMSRRAANATKIEWPETENLPPITAAALGSTVGSATATSIAVATGTGAYFKANDFVRNEATGEVFRVDSVSTDTLTVVRGIGNSGTGIIFAATTDKLVRLGNASAQGATTPDLKMVRVVFNWNWTGIQRDGFGVTESTAKAKMYGGNFLDFERKRQLVMHKAAIERQLFFGKRDRKTDATANGSTNRHQPFVGGLVGQYITANITHVNGALSRSNLETALRPIFRYGSNRRWGFCSPLFFSAISGFQLSGLGLSSYQAAADQYGVSAKRYETGAGDELILVLKRDWGDYPTATPGAGGMMVVVDLDRVAYAPYRSTTLKENRQANNADEIIHEYLTEFSLECVLGGSSGGSGNGVHGIIDGVTG